MFLTALGNRDLILRIPLGQGNRSVRNRTVNAHIRSAHQLTLAELDLFSELYLVAGKVLTYQVEFELC
jgi:hypothetical protein